MVFLTMADKHVAHGIFFPRAPLLQKAFVSFPKATSSMVSNMGFLVHSQTSSKLPISKLKAILGCVANSAEFNKQKFTCRDFKHQRYGHWVKSMKLLKLF
jgi:hypothetical protein